MGTWSTAQEGGTLRAVLFDLARLETRGTPVAVLPRLATTQQGAGNFVVAADGTLAYVDAPDATRARTLVWVDRQGREEPLAAPARPYYQPRVSPDGTRVAVAIFDQEYDIWVWDLARQTLSRRTFDPGEDFFPVWTPDGGRLVFHSQRGSGPTLFWQPADGTGAAEALSSGLGEGMLPSGVTPDGTQVLFSVGGRDLMVLALDGARGQPIDSRVKPLIQTPANERNGVVSPDGHWLAYESDSSGRFEIYVRPFPDTRARGNGCFRRLGAHGRSGRRTARSCSTRHPVVQSWPCGSTLAAPRGTREARGRSSRGHTIPKAAVCGAMTCPRTSVH